MPLATSTSRLTVLAALAALLGAVPARAQAPAPTPSPAASPRAPEPPTVTASAKDGFTVQSADGNFKLRLRGYLHADLRVFPGDSDSLLAIDQFLLRRARPGIELTLARRFDLVFLPDFAEGKAVVQDAYADLRYATAVRLRIGKFKSPLGLERMQSATTILFIERGLPTAIVPNRDLGLELYGEPAKGRVFYAVGVMNGVPDGASGDGDTNDSKDVVGRLFLQPWKETGPRGLRGLGFGVAGSTGKQSGVLGLPIYRTPSQNPFFAYSTGVTASGTRTRLTPQASYENGPVRLLAEWAQSKQDVAKAKVVGTMDNRAWEATGSVMLTGEKPGWALVTPKKAFDPSHHGWGAFEIAARVTELRVDDEAFTLGFADPAKSARKATAWAVGLNWHLNRNVKQSINYEHTTFEGGATVGNRKAENAILFRTQLAY